MSTVTVTPEELRTRLAEAEADLREAERAVGAAVLQGESPKTASQLVTAARGTVEVLEAALDEQRHRDRESQKGEAARENARACRSLVEWWAEHLRRIEPVLRLREELDEAEAHAMALGSVFGALRMSRDRFEQWFPAQIHAGRIPSLSRRLPESAVIGGDESRFHRPRRANDTLLTREDCGALAAELEAHLEAVGKPASER